MEMQQEREYRRHRRNNRLALGRPLGGRVARIGPINQIKRMLLLYMYVCVGPETDSASHFVCSNSPFTITLSMFLQNNLRFRLDDFLKSILFDRSNLMHFLSTHLTCISNFPIYIYIYINSEHFFFKAELNTKQEISIF